MDRHDRSSGPSRPGDSAETGDIASARPSLARVLVVEDQALIALALVADLAAMNCVVVGRAASGEAAVELARRLAPDIVVMDIRLAGPLDGVEAAALIKRECAPRIIFVTAYADGPERARMEALRPVAILAKPYHPNELNLAVRVSGRQRIRYLPQQPVIGVAD
jgi:DNA-binding NarL/FixJ family response regulator